MAMTWSGDESVRGQECKECQTKDETNFGRRKAILLIFSFIGCHHSLHNRIVLCLFRSFCVEFISKTKRMLCDAIILGFLKCHIEIAHHCFVLNTSPLTGIDIIRNSIQIGVVVGDSTSPSFEWQNTIPWPWTIRTYVWHMLSVHPSLKTHWK